MLYHENASGEKKNNSKSVAASFVFHKSARRSGHPSQTYRYIILLWPSKVEFIVAYYYCRHYYYNKRIQYYDVVLTSAAAVACDAHRFSR